MDHSLRALLNKRSPRLAERLDASERQVTNSQAGEAIHCLPRNPGYSPDPSASPSYMSQTVVDSGLRKP